MDRVESYINDVLRPKIQGDGGEMLFVSRDGDTVFLQLRGECSKCSITDRCLEWARRQIEQDTGESVRLAAEKIKPFFWDQE